jgi:chromosomal replication initiator protein
LARLAEAIAQRVGPQRFHVWFDNSTKLELKHDGLEIAVPNDFISEWIGSHFARPIQEAVHEVLGCSLAVKFLVVPQLFPPSTSGSKTEARARLEPGSSAPSAGVVQTVAVRRGPVVPPATPVAPGERSLTSGRMDDPARSPGANPLSGTRARLRHTLETFVVGPGNQLAFNAVDYVAEYPGAQYNPLFLHGGCGLGKTHLLQGLCRRFIDHHPTRKWLYLTGEEFTNEFLAAMRGSRLDTFRRRLRELDLLVIDDVHFIANKGATREELLHTFNAIEAMGRQVVMASDSHPRLIEQFGESLINRFVSGMVVRIDPPNYATRCEILRAMSQRARLPLPEEVVNWIARRVTQNVRELEGAMNRIAAHMRIRNRDADVEMAQEALGDLDRMLVQPVRPESVLASVCEYFGLEHKDLMSGRRQRTISLARSVAMFLVRKTAKLSFPEIGSRLGKRNHSTVISACRRIERAVLRNESLAWSSPVGERSEEAQELVQRLEEQARAMS